MDNDIACPHQSLALQNIGNIPDGLIGTFEFIVIKASDTPNKAEGIQQMAVPCENIGHCLGAVTGKLKGGVPRIGHSYDGVGSGFIGQEDRKSTRLNSSH